MSVSYDDKRVWSNIHLELKDELLLRLISSLECLICSEVMHVPFLSICGHSFCYGCLDAWFETKVNCPTCRKDMDEPPILNIQLREMSKSITDLVIDTLEDEKHKTELKDARQRLIDEYDQATRAKSLFRDAFNSARTLVDRSDGVPRCGNCHWEAHGSVCLHCGTRFRTPRGDLYYDSDDGDAYNEDREEVELYGVDHATYDSEDSFVDNRDVHEINNDREGYESDGILSSGDNQSVVELWEGFRRDSEMYRGDEERPYFEDPVDVLDLGLEPDRDHDHDHDHDHVHADERRFLDDEVEVVLHLGLENDYEGDAYDDHYGIEERHEAYAMEDAVDELHDQDVEDYTRRFEPASDDGSDSEWGTRVSMGRRPVHIIDLDSE